MPDKSKTTTKKGSKSSTTPSPAHAPAQKAQQKTPQPKATNTLPTGSANSSSADPDARHRSLDAPVGQVTRHT